MDKLYETQSEKVDLLIPKLITASKEIPAIEKDASGRFKYASLPNIISVVKPVLLKYGLFILQGESLLPNGMSVLETKIFEPTGQFIRSLSRTDSEAFIEAKQNMSGIQNHGSNISYLKRYAVANMLFLEIQEDDPDAFAKPQASRMSTPYVTSGIQGKCITESQLNLLKMKLRSKPIEDAILKDLDIASIDLIPIGVFNDVLKRF